MDPWSVTISFLTKSELVFEVAVKELSQLDAISWASINGTVHPDIL